MNATARASDTAADSLRITEIFYSLQGEARSSGLPTVFIRLTGCPLRCTYCDTAYAFTGGQRMLVDDILDQVSTHQTRQVCVTGGEPLAQPGCHTLLKKLCDTGYQVSLETSGAMDISAVDTRVSRVLDIKTPASKEQHRNLWENLNHLTTHDQIKFVICDRADFVWAKDLIQQHQLANTCEILFSASHAALAPEELAQWILDDHLPVRLQLQLHKYLWGDKPGV